MIIVMRREASKEAIDNVIKKVESFELKPVPLYGTERTVIAVIGDERVLHIDSLRAMEGVDKVMPVLKPYKLVSRETKEEDSVIDVDGVKIGGSEICTIAGPCSVEDEEQIISIAKEVKKAGAKILRGGAFKPRTSPYDFQGLGEEGLKLLAKARDETGLKIVTEVMDTKHVKLVEKYADIFQIGARNMQNFNLLKEVGKSNKPVLLKRGMSATLKEFLMCAEYIMSEGNHNVILCERGIRTFSDYTRNTLDLCVVPAAKELSHLPVIVDPSHGTGKRQYITAMSRAAIAAGADGLIIEAHTKPEESKSDADQTISTDAFAKLMQDLRPVAEAMGRKI